MDKKVLIIGGAVVGGIALGFGGYILYKHMKGEDWKPSFARERLEHFRPSEPGEYGYSEDEDEYDGINVLKMYADPEIIEKPSYNDEKPPIGEVAANLAANRYRKAFEPIDGSEELTEAEKLAEEVSEDVSDGASTEEEADVAMVEEWTDIMKTMPWDPGIEPISLEDYLNGEPFFDKIACTWFPNEGILAGGDDLGEMDPEDTVGLKAIALIKAGYKNPENGETSVIVRCRQEGIDYQLYCTMPGLTYEEALADAMTPEAARG